MALLEPLLCLICGRCGVGGFELGSHADLNRSSLAVEGTPLFKVQRALTRSVVHESAVVGDINPPCVLAVSLGHLGTRGISHSLGLLIYGSLRDLDTVAFVKIVRRSLLVLGDH